MKNVKPFNYDDVNFMELVRAEIYHETRGFYHKSMLNSLLNYFVYYIREHILMDGESIETNSFKGRCGLATDLGIELADKYGFSYYPFNIGDILDTKNIHKVFLVGVPLKEETKLFLVDPTFRQFCKPETFNVGYVLDLDNESLVERLIKYGYFEIGFDNLKTYLDAFKFIFKQDYKDTPKEKYWRLIGEHPSDDFRTSGRIIETPLDVLNRVAIRQTKMDL